MIGVFCLRLALGMIASMLILPTAVVPPRFFRVQYLTGIGLLLAAAFFLGERCFNVCWGNKCPVVLISSIVMCVFGSIVWNLDTAPLARPILWITALLVTHAVWGTSAIALSGSPDAWRFLLELTNAMTAAALLGTTTSAMLMGHSYLIAPAMSLTPLMRLLAAMGVSLAMRAVLASVGLYQWTEQAGPAGINFEDLLWLSLRWLIGLVGVLALTWMAWESARIRSTQSATGILYVAVVLCFLGELASQFLVAKTGFTL